MINIRYVEDAVGVAPEHLAGPPVEDDDVDDPLGDGLDGEDEIHVRLLAG